jgi:transcriptional regulator with XRE-family HTH domain
MDTLKRFGEKVREQRIKRGLSQEELAELSGLHRTYISSLELGKRNVSLINIYALAKALDVTPDKLLKPE